MKVTLRIFSFSLVAVDRVVQFYHVSSSHGRHDPTHTHTHTVSFQTMIVYNILTHTQTHTQCTHSLYSSTESAYYTIRET